MRKLVVFNQVSIDGYFVDIRRDIVNPLVLGAGRTIFQGITTRLGLKLTQSRTFKNGRVFLSYVAA